MPALTARILRRRDRERQTRHRERSHLAAWAGPVVLGFVYGLYVLWLDSNKGASTPSAALLGLIAAIVMAVVCYAVGRAQHSMSAETRGIVYGVIFGLAMGFLVSLTGDSVLKCTAIALACGAGMGVAAFYINYGDREYHESAERAEPGKTVEPAKRDASAKRDVRFPR